MNVDLFGVLMSVTLYLTGAWIGWRMSKLHAQKVSESTHGFWRGVSSPGRIFTRAGAVVAIATGLAFLAWHLDSVCLASSPSGSALQASELHKGPSRTD